MKFYDAVEIVRNRRILSEEEKLKAVENGPNLAKRLWKASIAIKNDLAKISRVVENKTMTHLVWKELGSNIYLEVYNNFYELADGCSDLLDRQARYEGGNSKYKRNLEK